MIFRFLGFFLSAVFSLTSCLWFVFAVFLYDSKSLHIISNRASSSSSYSSSLSSLVFRTRSHDLSGSEVAVSLLALPFFCLHLRLFVSISVLLLRWLLWRGQWLGTATQLILSLGERKCTRSSPLHLFVSALLRFIVSVVVPHTIAALFVFSNRVSLLVMLFVHYCCVVVSVVLLSVCCCSLFQVLKV